MRGSSQRKKTKYVKNKIKKNLSFNGIKLIRPRVRLIMLINLLKLSFKIHQVNTQLRIKLITLIWLFINNAT